MTDFHTLAQLSSDALLVVAGGAVTYANPAAQALLAPPAGAPGLLGQPVGALWQPNPLDDAGAWNGDGQLAPTQVLLLPGDSPGSAAALELTATRSLTPDGPVYYVKARRVLGPGDRLAERVRTALALSPDAAMVVDAATLAFLDANPAACALMGMPLEAVRARGPTTMRRRDGTGTEDFHALYAQLIQHSPQALTHEYDFLAEDGRTIPIAATRQALNVDGRWLIFITWRDISAQVSAQALVQQFKDSFDQTPDATNIIDVQTLSYVYVNEPFIKLMGLPRERVLAGGPQSMPRDIVVVDDLADFLASVVAQHPQALIREKTVTLPDGRQATFESHHQAVFSGGRWLVRATRVDITQRKQQQQHLHRVMAAVDSAVDAIFIIDPRTMGYVEVNEAASLLFETPRETLRTLRVPDLMPRLSGPFSQAQLAAHYEALIHQAPQPMTNETAVRQSSGRWIPVENVRRAVRVNGEWLIVSVMRDITERTLAQERLEQFKAAFDQTSDAVAIVDIDAMAYVYNNDANLRLLGISRAEMDKLTPAEVARRLGDTADQKAFFARLVAQYPEPITREIAYTGAGGRRGHYSIRHQAMRCAGGWLAISTKTDITTRKEEQTQLELLVAAMDSAPDAIAILDPDTFQYVHVNDAVCRLHGLTRDEVMASGMLGMFKHFTPESLRRRYDELIAMAPQAVSEERTVRRADGSEVVTEAVRRALRVGDRWLVISVSRDISERKAAQERIERFAAIVNLSSDAVLVHDPQRMALIDVNEAACRLYGYSRGQLLALPPTMNRPDQTMDDMRRIYEATIAAAPRAVRAEFTTKRSDGSSFPAEAYRQAIPSSDGWLVVVTVRDQTERLAAQARIERFAAIVNLSADALFVVDRETMNIVDVNDSATRIYGYPREALLGRPVYSVTATYRDAGPRMAAEYDEVIARSPQVSVLEMTPQRADGSTFHAEVQRMAIQSEGRWLVVTTVRDISERKAAQAQLELMHQAINAAPDAIVVIDPQTLEYVDVNEATAQMYGLTREQLLARGARKGLGGKSTDEEMRQFYAPIVAQAPVASVEERATHLNGRDMTLEFTRRAVNVDGRWLIVSVNRDITERKAAQARVERFAAIVNLSAEAVFVVDRESMVILDVNESTCRMYGYAREDLVGRPVQSITFSYKDTPGRMEAEYDQVIAQSPRATLDEKTARLSNGNTIQAEVQRMALQSEGRWLIVTIVRDISERKAAQARQELLTAAIEAAPDGIAVVDPQTLQYLHVNDAVCRTHAASREQLMSLGVDGVFRGQLAPDAIRALYQSVIDSYPGATSEERAIVALDGSTAYYEAVRRAVRVDGRWLIVSMNRDVTERKNAQARIERFAAVLNLSADAVLLVDRASMRIIDVNEAACRMHGYSRDELLALPPHLSREGTTLEQLAADYDEAIRQSPAVVHIELTGRRADGSTFVAEVLRQALRQATDGGWIIAITVRDISDRKAAEARLNRLRAAIDFAPDAIYLIDPVALEYVDMNKAAGRAYGMTRDEVAAMGMQRFLAHLGRMPGPQTLQEMRQRYADLIADHPRIDVQERLVRLPGRAPLYTETLRRAVQIDGQWLILSVLRDVTERKLEQQRMERFAAVLNLSADAVLLVDYASARIIDVNEAACRMYGYTRDQMLALPPHQGRGDTTREQLIADYDEAIRHSPGVVHAEITARRADGSTFIAEVQRQALHSEADGGWIIAIMARDVTQRKAAEAGLKRLKAVVDVAPDGMYIIDPQTQEYVALNHAAGQLYGLTREEVMRMGMVGFMTWLGSFDSNITLESVRERHAWLIDNYPQVHVGERLVRLPGRADIVTETLRQAVQVDGEWLILVVVRDITERKRQQARMELLVQAFNVAPDPIVVVDPELMTFVDVNEAATRLVGLPREEMLARGLAGVFPQEQVQDGSQNVYTEAIEAAPDTVTRERVVFDAAGNRRFLEGTRRAAKIDGRWLVVSVTRDITERKVAQERIERFAAVVNLSADAVFVVDRATLRIIDVNEAACRMYGYGREELLALAPNANRPGMDTSALEQLYDETIAHSPNIHHVEHDAVRSDGSMFAAETHRLAIRVDGRWLILATVRDITERKRAEEEIRKRVAELELLREAYDAAFDAILIADPETMQYYDVNHAAVQLLGVPREVLLTGGVGASYYSTAGEPFDPERMRKGYQYVISRAPEAVVDVRTINPLGLGGRDTVIEFSRRAVNIDSRWVIVTLMRDITAARRAEEEIRQRVAELTRSNQELEQFAYVTSHDLSEPLRMVASYTQLLSRRYADKFDDDGREFIKYAVDGAQRMKQLIDDLLMYSRAGRSKVPMRHIRLDRSLDDALANLAHAIERNGATIERGPLPELVCEKAGLTQVFQNLVGNAIKFRGEAAPVVRISAVEDEHHWTISVADNGIGIAPEYFQRIFIIFQRLHARTKYEGTGIGLSICKKIVERHGGQITVASEPGQGTTFSFTLSKSLTESESS